MLAFHQRIATEEVQQHYRVRPSTAEFPNAECRNESLQQFCVRSPETARVVALQQALALVDSLWPLNLDRLNSESS